MTRRTLTTENVVDALADRLPDAARTQIQRLIEKLELSSRRRATQRTQLLVRRLKFDGERRGDFKFGPGVNIIRAGNLKGKSTILNLIELSLTGKKKLKSDVEKWIASVSLEFELDGRPHVIEYARRPAVRGALYEGTIDTTDARVELLRFSSSSEMKAKLESFFNEVFGLDVLTGTQKSSRKDSDELLLTQTSFKTYFGGMHIDQETGYAHLVTEHMWGNQYMKIVGMLLGVAGMRPLFAATTRLDHVTHDLSRETAYQRRSHLSAVRSVAAIDTDIERVSREIAELKARRTQAYSAASSTDLHDQLERRTDELLTVGRDIEDATEQLRRSEATVLDDERSIAAIQEAIASKRHLSVVLPHHCPVCDTLISRKKIESGRDSGRCYLCSEEVADGADEQLLVSLSEYLVEVRGSLRQHQQLVKRQEATFAAVAERRDKLLAEKASLQKRMRDVQRRTQEFDDDLEDSILRLGRLNAERDAAVELALGGADGDRLEDLLLEKRVLTELIAWLRENESRRNDALLANFASKVLEFSRRCGLPSVEAIEFDKQLRPRITQNGTFQTFEDLTPGEKLRFVLAFYFAMAIVSADEGSTGAHPGLLLIDSPGKEEMVATDFEAVVGLLSTIEAEYRGSIQAIVATALRDIRRATGKRKQLFLESDEEYLFA